MKTRILATFFISLLAVALVQSQQDSHLALYRYNMQVYNPAFTATHEDNVPELNVSLRSQWIGIEGSPEVQTVSLGFPVKRNNIGLGLLVVNDVTSIQGQTLFYGSFSYRLKLNDNLHLYMGVEAGGTSFRVDFTNINTTDQIGSDPLLQNISQFNPNVGVGFYLKGNHFYLSASAPKILRTKHFKESRGISSTATDELHSYLGAAVDLPIANNWKIVASTLALLVQNAPSSLVVNAGLGYKKIELTMGYQFDSSLVGTFSVDTDDFLTIGYSYGVSTNNTLIRTVSRGTHEVMARFRLKSHRPSSTKNASADYSASTVSSK